MSPQWPAALIAAIALASNAMTYYIGDESKQAAVGDVGAVLSANTEAIVMHYVGELAAKNARIEYLEMRLQESTIEWTE